jgi:hypothetical protein
MFSWRQHVFEMQSKYLVQEVVDELNLVAHLSPTEDGEERTLWRVQGLSTQRGEKQGMLMMFFKTAIFNFTNKNKGRGTCAKYLSSFCINNPAAR